MRNILFITLIMMANGANAQIGKSTTDVKYSHATVGTAAIDATAAANVNTNLFGWSICHDAGSASAYLAISVGADPDVDGVRIGAGACFECVGCGSKSLIDANVKGSAAATGYSVIQKK